MRTALQALLFLIGILACCLVSYLIGDARGYERGRQETIQKDTVWCADTQVDELMTEI